MQILLTAFAQFTVSNLIPRHLGPTFICWEYEARTNCQSTTRTIWLSPNPSQEKHTIHPHNNLSSSYGTQGAANCARIYHFNPEPAKEFRDSGYIIVANLIGGMTIWLLIAYTITKHRPKSNAHAG